MEQKEMLFALSKIMSIVGFEAYDEEALTALFAPYFDEHEYDAIGNHILSADAEKKTPPACLLTHTTMRSV